MSVYGVDQEKAITNCDAGPSIGRKRPLDEVRRWHRVAPGHVVELLVESPIEQRHQARQLLGMMEHMSWRIQAPAQAQDRAGRLVSNVRLIVLTIAGRNHQLHCSESPSLQLERISA
ncbi:hypothetical protein [Alloalcanivorax xenomutans]|uniref:hypothetical protein n=1 Tax=Alloalcanivorax xenomutans TaxID=1094342 RepID=UPI0024E1CD8E|nr:hypothetical protein [Alloalcanivorax xenomutans]